MLNYSLGVIPWNMLPVTITEWRTSGLLICASTLDTYLPQVDAAIRNAACEIQGLSLLREVRCARQNTSPVMGFSRTPHAASVASRSPLGMSLAWYSPIST